MTLSPLKTKYESNPDTNAFTDAYVTLADAALQPSDIVNNTTGGGVAVPLSAEMGKSLQDELNALGGDVLIATNNLSDLDDASIARSNLGLDTAATQPSSSFATSAQGTLADSALQSGASRHVPRQK